VAALVTPPVTAPPLPANPTQGKISDADWKVLAELQKTGGTFLPDSQLKMSDIADSPFTYKSIAKSVLEEVMRTSPVLSAFHTAYETLWEGFYRLHHDYIEPLVRISELEFSLKNTIDKNCEGWQDVNYNNPVCSIRIALRYANLEKTAVLSELGNKIAHSRPWLLSASSYGTSIAMVMGVERVMASKSMGASWRGWSI